MSKIKVNSLEGVGASTPAISIDNTSGTCTANITNNLSNRNLIINGAMQVAQRSAGPVAVSDNSNENYQTLDRFKTTFGNSAVGAANISQSTDAPTTLGFTKSHKTDVTTVNTTASGQQMIQITYRIEGQDLRSSGWNHLSASSFLTLSFYFKTTKTGTSKLPIGLRTRHGTNYYYVQNVTVTDPTNWNRYTVTIPGNSNLQIDDANTAGMDINFSYYTGPDKDTSSEGSWGTTNAYSTSDSTNYFDNTSNDMFITGVQLEVGSVATDFEHRSFGQELLLCQRYYQRFTSPGTYTYLCVGNMDNDGDSTQMIMNFRIPFRTNISSMDTTGTATDYAIRRDSTQICDALPLFYTGTTHSCFLLFAKTGVGWSTGQCVLAVFATSGAYLGFSAEL